MLFIASGSGWGGRRGGGGVQVIMSAAWSFMIGCYCCWWCWCYCCSLTDKLLSEFSSIAPPPTHTGMRMTGLCAASVLVRVLCICCRMSVRTFWQKYLAFAKTHKHSQTHLYVQLQGMVHCGVLRYRGNTTASVYPHLPNLAARHHKKAVKA